MRMATVAWGVVVGVGLAMGGPQAAGPGCEGLEARVAAAKTAADHQSIAICYEAEAKRARARAAAQRRMAASYNGPVKLPLLEQSSSLADTLEAEAKKYDAMAATHRDLARAEEEPASGAPAEAPPPAAERASPQDAPEGAP